MKKVKIKANNTFNPVQKLIDLGYKNCNKLVGDAKMPYYYYGESDGDIQCSHPEEKGVDDYEEIFLSNEDSPVKIKNIKKMLVSYDGKEWTERYVIATYKEKAICIARGSNETFEKERRFSHTLVWNYYKELPEFNPEPGTWIYVSNGRDNYEKRLFVGKHEGKFYCLYSNFHEQSSKGTLPYTLPTHSWSKAKPLKYNN